MAHSYLIHLTSPRGGGRRVVHPMLHSATLPSTPRLSPLFPTHSAPIHSHTLPPSPPRRLRVTMYDPETAMARRLVVGEVNPENR